MIKILIEKLLYKLGYVSLERHKSLANAYTWALHDIKESFNFIDCLRDEKISLEAKVMINQFMDAHVGINDFETETVYEEME